MKREQKSNHGGLMDSVLRKMLATPPLPASKQKTPERKQRKKGG